MLIWYLQSNRFYLFRLMPSNNVCKKCPVASPVSCEEMLEWDPFKANWCLNKSDKKSDKNSLFWCRTFFRHHLRYFIEEESCVNTWKDSCHSAFIIIIIIIIIRVRPGSLLLWEGLKKINGNFILKNDFLLKDSFVSENDQKWKLLGKILNLPCTRI